MNLTLKILENPWVRLEPLGAEHKEALRAACTADPDTWNRLYPYSMLGEAFDRRWEDYLVKSQADGSWMQYAVMVGGRCMGMTCHIGTDAANASVEVGGTYYHPQVRGGAVNPAAKRLMMGHAFDAGARRVVYRVDAINARSRAAVLKLGAVQEGLLRQDRVTWTGRIRDTAIFSVLAEEWPGVRDRLDARLSSMPRA
ncbi:MAG: GNAT family protein [Alphaproteobacteria bacterium]